MTMYGAVEKQEWWEFNKGYRSIFHVLPTGNILFGHKGCRFVKVEIKEFNEEENPAQTAQSGAS